LHDNLHEHRGSTTRPEPGRPGDAFGQAVLTLLLLLFAVGASAQTRVIERYIYDAAGNIVGIETVTVEGPPVIDTIAPDRLFAGSTRVFEISGQNLLGAGIEATRPGISVEHVESEADTLRFELSADAGVALGPTDLAVSTLSGAATAEIIVRPRLPRLIARPLPLVVGADGGQAALDLTLLEPSATDWLLDVDVADASVATASSAQIALDQGQVAVPGGVIFTGGAVGSTALQISVEGATLLEAGVFSTSFGELPAGDWQFESGVLGVRKQRPVRLVEQGPIVGSLGVLRPDADTAPLPLGADLASARLGVGRGPVLFDVAPDTVSREAGIAELVLSGAGLAAVEAARIVPPDGVVVDALDVAPDGSSAGIQLLMDPAAAPGLRRVIVETASGPIRPMDPAADRFYLAGELPEIDSISPSSVELGEVFDLTVRGRNFSPTARLTFSPSGGIVIDTPIAISDDQSTIQATVQVAEDAPVGARVVQVQTAAGASPAVPSGANTLQVLQPGLVTFSPVVSSRVGVDRGAGPSQSDALAVSPALGIARGDVLAELEPRVVETATSTTLLGLGSGLDAVTSVAIDPPDDIAVVGLATSPETVEIMLEIGPAAGLGVRAIRLLTATGPVALARPELGTLRIVSPQPVVEGISPVYIEPGASPVEVVIRGANFQQAESVTVIPQSDLFIGAFSIAPAGDEIRVPISAAGAAATGPRVVQVTTPAGASPAAISDGNRLYIGDPEARLITPLIAPSIGVERPGTPGSIGMQQFSHALGVGRPVTGVPAEIEVAVFDATRKVVRGKALLGLQPPTVPQGFSGEVVIPGVGLELDIEVVLDNGEGVELTGPPVVELDAGGAPFVRVPLAVAEDAPITRHRVRVSEPDTGGGVVEIPFLDPANSLLRVAGPAPVIQSIEPIITLSGENFPLLIRGFNLAEATEVRVIPDQGISVGTQLDINAGGTELTVTLDVSAGADPGPRLIQVVAPAGNSGDVANAANTLTVVEP